MEEKAKVAGSMTRGAIVISGNELKALSDHQWKTLTEYEEVVFARTTPEQKLRIVREYQTNNVVAMTGDGVNDAPSLKAADVGIALGSGSDIAMEAADMVLLDTFSSVVVAVQYGRVVFDNLKKASQGCHTIRRSDRALTNTGLRSLPISYLRVASQNSGLSLPT